MTIQPWRIAVLAAATSLALAACGGKDGASAQQQGAGAKQQMPAPTVSVLTVHPENVLLETDLPGRLEAVRSAPIIPQVSGIVKRRLFQEGDTVRAGQPLYQLDDASYVANLESARASLASAQAALAKANADVSRYQPLVAADAISKQEWDAALAAQRSAQAQVKSANAAIKAAQVNVNHAHITAPISGVIGQSLVTEGALVNANSTQMALITENDYLYVNIKQSASDMLKLRKQLASRGKRKRGSERDTGRRQRISAQSAFAVCRFNGGRKHRAIHHPRHRAQPRTHFDERLIRSREIAAGGRNQRFCRAATSRYARSNGYCDGGKRARRYGAARGKNHRAKRHQLGD